MPILIGALPGDIHPLSVQWAVRAKGREAHIMCWSDFPQTARATFSIGNESGPEQGLNFEDMKLNVSDISVFWNHRTAKAVPPEEISAFDRKPIEIGSRMFYEAITHALEANAFCVNAPSIKRYIDNKANQLTLAKACGFHVPETILSNDYDVIRDFIARRRPCITKPLYPMQWRTEDASVSTFTTEIESLDGFSPLSVTACPMIYQEKIVKQCEYRVVVMGHEIAAFQIDSQVDESAALDWRKAYYRNLRVHPVELPKDAILAIRRFMQQSGAVFGSFDFALNDRDELIFFEINEQGQWLWLEELCPDVPLLDMFAEFLISGRPDFEYRPNGRVLRFGDIEDEAMRMIEEAEARHVKHDIQWSIKEYTAA